MSFDIAGLCGAEDSRESRVLGPGTASVQVQVWCGWLVNACIKEAQVLVEKQAELWEVETESSQ